jgi:hypothetical protein
MKEFKTKILSTGSMFDENYITKDFLGENYFDINAYIDFKCKEIAA